MDGAFRPRSDEPVMSLIGDESGEYPVQKHETIEQDDDDPILPPQSAEQRKRTNLRDRLARLVFEEEFISFARHRGQEEMYLVGFESDPMRIWNRLDLDRRSGMIRTRLERINGLEALALVPSEHLNRYVKSESLLALLSDVRRDWIRGKVQKRAEERRLREKSGTPNQEDLLWKQIR